MNASAPLVAPRFSGKHALVTGGGSGIGRAIALGLARQGAQVRIVGLEEEPLAQTVAMAPRQISAEVCDLRDVPRWRRIIDEGVCPDILINNAAMSLRTDLFNPADTSLADAMGVNFGGAWHGSRHAARRMAGNGGGRIVNITSVHADMVERGSTAYAVAKAALQQLTRCLAVEWADHGILVNAVAPGFVDTPMSRAKGVNELESEWFQSQYVATGRIPLRRAAQAEEMVAPVLFLASAENTYVTGHVIIADGGLSLTL